MKKLGLLWTEKYCKKCNTTVKVGVHRILEKSAGSSGFPVKSILKHDCVNCDKTIISWDLTEEAQAEWEENAEYCSQNFTNYIMLKDKERAEQKN